MQFSSLMNFFRSSKVALIKALSYGIYYGLFQMFDPFGLSSAINAQAENLFFRIISQRYPIEAQSKIAVFLIDEKPGGLWPPSYARQAEWLQKILNKNPKAIFLDFNYQYMHGQKTELDFLIKTIIQSKTTKIPIYLAMHGNSEAITCSSYKIPLGKTKIWGNKPTIEVITKIPDKVGHVKYAFVGWSGCQNRYLLYPGNNSNFDTPAFAMFKQYCKDNKDNLTEGICPEILSDDPKKFIENNFGDPMVVVWGSKTRKQSQDYFAINNDNIPCNSPGILEQLFQLPWEMFKEDSERGKRYNCVFTDTVFSDGKLALNKSLEEDYIKNRYVFIGASMNMENDFIVNPVNGRVAGVYLHAMAFDNLINYQEHYAKGMGGFSKIFIETGVLVLYFFTIKKWNPVFTNFYFYIYAIGIKFVSPLFCGLGLAYIFWWIFKWAPADWLGISVFAFIYCPIEIKDILKRLLIDLGNVARR